MSDQDYRDTAARHHVDCVCAACQRAQFEEQQQRTRDSMSRDVNEYLDREAERATKTELDYGAHAMRIIAPDDLVSSGNSDQLKKIAEAVFDPKLWFGRFGEVDLDRAERVTAAEYGYIADTDPPTWEELVAWLVANPCDSEQSRAKKLLAAFVMRRIV